MMGLFGDRVVKKNEQWLRCCNCRLCEVSLYTPVVAGVTHRIMDAVLREQQDQLRAARCSRVTTLDRPLSATYGH